MVGVLLIVGITLVVVTTIWMIEHASHRGVAGWRLLFPFLTGDYIHQYWSDIRWVAMARVLGFVCIILGFAVAIANNPKLLNQPALFWQPDTSQATRGNTQAGMTQFMETKQKALLVMRQDQDRDLSGQLHGKRFVYQKATLIDGVLSARQGDGFLPSLEVRILINIEPSGLTRTRSFYVQPTDQHPPVVYLSWQDDNGRLQTRIIKSGYSLELQLAPRSEYRLNGFMQLILPGKLDNFLSGNFIIDTSHLRYIDGQVDTTFNHPDTLKYLARQYLLGHLPKGAVVSIVVDQVTMDASHNKGKARARVLLSNQQLEEHYLTLRPDDFGWHVNADSDRTVVLREASAANQADTTNVGQFLPPVQIEASALMQYVNQTVTLVKRDGSKKSAVIEGLDKHGLLVADNVSAGSVKYHIAIDQLAKVLLSNGQVLVLHQTTPVAPAEEVATPSQTPEAPTTPAVSPTQAPPAEKANQQAKPETTTQDKLGLLQYKPLLGQVVTVVGIKGERHQGILSDVVAEQLTLTVSMGAGSMQYFYRPGEIQSLTPLKSP